MTRWSRQMTQSLTNSSRPCRVIWLSRDCSPVMIAVTPLSLSQRKSRRSSARRMPSFGRLEKSDSTVSRATRLAPIRSIMEPRRTNNPSRSYSPVSSISLRSMWTWSTASFRRRMSDGTSKPRLATFAAISASVSSKLMKTPGSPKSLAPRTMNSMARSVLPHPALPQTSVGRPSGRPPSVISSSPRMPVRHFGICSKCVQRFPALPSRSYS